MAARQSSLWMMQLLWQQLQQWPLLWQLTMKVWFSSCGSQSCCRSMKLSSACCVPLTAMHPLWSWGCFLFHELYPGKLGKVECIWNLMVRGDAREGKWSGNWWMEWVVSTLTLTRDEVYPALLPLMGTPRLPVVDWTDVPADLNGLVRFGERRNLVSACVSSHFKRSLTIHKLSIREKDNLMLLIRG